MKKILLGMLAIVVLTVVVALIAPSFIDWNAYRAEIATEVRKATGRKMVIEGPVDVALLPRPTLSAAKVRLANLEGATAPDMVRLESLDVRVAFLPLLSGKVVVDSIELKGADIELEALADGRVNWELGPERRPGMPASGSASTGGGTGSGADGDAVRLNQVVISGGRVTWRDSRNGTIERIENINARLAAETLSGPFVVRGKASVRDMPLTLEARVGRIENGRPTPLTAELGIENAGATADVKGSFMLGDVPSAKVRIEAEGGSLARVVGAVTGGPGPALLGHRFTLQADIAGDSKAVTVNDMSLVLNGTRATGGISATLGPVPSVDAALGINTLDLDSWLSALQKTAEKPAEKTPSPSGIAQKGDAQGTAAAASPGGFDLPKDLRLAVDARIGGVTYKKGAIRDIEMQAVLERGTVQVSRIAAQLPGGGEAEIAGRVTNRDGALRFDGNVEAGVADARQFMDWLEIDHAAIAPDRLHRTSFKSSLAVGGDRLELRDIDLRFDTTKVGGGVVIALRDRPGIGATILIDRLNLDNFLAKGPAAGAAPVAAAKAPDGKAGGSKENGNGGGLAALGGFDANIRAQADRLTYQGVTLEGLTLDSSLIGGDLTVKTMRIASLAGGTLDISGTVKAIDKAPVPDLRFALNSKQPERLFALAGIEPPVAPAKLTPLSLGGQFKAEAETTRVNATLGAGKLKASVNGTLTGLGGIPSVKLDLKADYPSFVDFVRLFDPAFTPRTAPKGSFSLVAKAETVGLDLKLTDVKATLGEAEVAGDATLALAAQRPRLTADFSAGTIVAEHFVPANLGGESNAADAGAKKAGVPGPGPAGASSGAPWSDEPFDLDGLRAFDADVRVRAKSLLWRAWTVDDPRIDMILADGTFDLRRVSGSTVGGTFQLSGSLAAPEKRAGAAALKADLDITRADLRKAMFNLSALDIASGKVTFRTSFQGKGASSRALVSSLDGSGRLEAVDGAITGFDLGAVNEKLKNLNEPASFLGLLQTAMSGGSTKFSSLTGTFKIEKGVVRSDDIALKADGGTGKATLTANLPRWQIDSEAVFQLSGHSDSPPFRMQLKGPLDSPSRVFNLNELQSWLVKRGIGGLIQDLIKKKDGSAQGKPAAPAQQAPSQGQSSQDQAAPGGGKKQPNPDEFIRGIFDLLNQGKKQP